MATNTYAMNPGGGFQGGGPGQRTAPGNDAFAGGSRTPASNPVAVGGSFTSVGAPGGPPPNFATPGTAFARNDRGSNIRIPYARVVSMHAKDQLPVKDSVLTGTGRKEAYEYDGLEAGELAWIMSKQFSIKPSYIPAAGAPPGDYVALGNEQSSSFAPIASAIDVAGFAHNVGRMGENWDLAAGHSPKFGMRAADGSIIIPSSGMGGAGVNRMERMAYTSWVEANMSLRIGRQVINLMATTVAGDSSDPDGDGNRQATGRRVTDNYNPVMDSEIEFWSRCWKQPVLRPYDNPRNGDGLEIVRDLANVKQRSRGPAYQASLFAVPDVAYALQQTKPGRPLQVGVPMMQGLYVMEKGPFLRGYGVDHQPVLAEIENLKSRSGRGKLLAEIDRHAGSDLAQRALVCELKKAGLMNWTPDGICLSKDNSGQDGATDAYFDAKLGQLYNIGVQGPCITKTWANQSSELAVLPMDKVFVFLVGELSYEISASGTVSDQQRAAANMTKGVAAQNFRPATVNEWTNADPARAEPLTGVMYSSLGGNASGIDVAGNNIIIPGLVADAAAAQTEIEDARDERYAFVEAQGVAAVAKYQQALSDAGGNPTMLNRRYRAMYQAIAAAEAAWMGPNRAAVQSRADTATALVQAVTSKERTDEVAGDSFKQIAQELRNGQRSVTNAELMNFRLVKGTSSWLANRSHFKAGDGKSRCGLKIGFCETGATRAEVLAELGFDADFFGADALGEDDAIECPPRTGNAEYILGGWCIGNVVDSAASRAFSHGQIRSAPNTYAINVNVNVEWWGADKLYSHYQDKERDAANAPSAGTTNMRTTSNARTPEMVLQEGAASLSAAQNRLITGENDVEGMYKQPNPYGADTDAKAVGKPGRNGGRILGDGDNGLDPRVWSGAQADAAEIAAATVEHFRVAG